MVRILANNKKNMASNNGWQNKWLAAIRDESNSVVKRVASAAANSSLFRSSSSSSNSTPQASSSSPGQQMISVAEVEATFNGMQRLLSNEEGGSVSAIEQALEPVWTLTPHQLALLKAKLDGGNRLHEKNWLYESTIASPLTGDLKYPFYNLANMVFRSPLRLTYPDPAKVIGALASFRGMRHAGTIPESRVDWPVRVHKHYEHEWLQTIEEWQIWLDLLTRQGFVPEMERSNPQFLSALYQPGSPGAPAYVEMWFLARYGNIPLVGANAIDVRFSDELGINLLDKMAPNMERAVALFAMCDSLNGLRTTMQAHVTRSANNPAHYLRFVRIFFYLGQYGADARQLQRFLSLGVPMEGLTQHMCLTINVAAINHANFAMLEEETLKPYLPVRPRVLYTPQEVFDFLPTFVQLRRDMWPYILGDTSGEVRIFIIREAQEFLGFDEL